jgi:multimeric flavodoxin WrbA
LREILKAGEKEAAETELMHFADFNLKPCDGCRTCFETENCIIKDDVEKMFEKMSRQTA